ncbi:hypothetical protein AJ80_06096 [Polytolypa hystricis UAMH7299]|uniref:Peptide hydrolase n=1 Tax=Polytolypa hystricis (strain UAMH7299) TaxID=1447883 RepID=A0A2B7XZ85_POLH7|nr:hypothetical protein AJ80_06096 [Polytolypa hystricis UAMH7299]
MFAGIQRLLATIAFFCATILVFMPPALAYSAVSDDTLKSIPRPYHDFDIKDGAILAPILRPRVPGTEGSRAVLQHFVQFFKKELPGWKLEFQNSTSKTPTSNGKDVPFSNLIASRDPPGAGIGDVRRLTLVAHYDSKLEPAGFIGATDSAAPCAIILHAVRSIDAALTRKWNSMKDDPSGLSFLDEHQGIQVFLLDGEEAFASWTDDDSLYGSRALAEAMEEEIYPAMSVNKSPIRAISLFVLLDLLGSKDPTVRSYFKTTHWAYQKLALLESRLRGLGLLKSSPAKKPAGRSEDPNAKDNPWFVDAQKKDNIFGSGITDDHVPFMDRGVDILHVIPMPFPVVWHTIDDDAEHLDIDTVEDWSTIISAFILEWLELDEAFAAVKKPADSKGGTQKTEL